MTSLRDAFNARHVDCWEWVGTKNADGYGLLIWDGKQYLAHRVSYELHRRPVPEGLFICHTCDNPSCVNPAHLYAGTHQDNMDDKVARGRCNSRQRGRLTDVQRIMSVFTGDISMATRKKILSVTGLGTNQLQDGLEECVKSGLLTKTKEDRAHVYTVVVKEN